MTKRGLNSIAVRKRKRERAERGKRRWEGGRESGRDRESDGGEQQREIKSEKEREREQEKMRERK